MKVLDHGYVNLVETWGSDERIIESARMSTNKGFQGWDTDAKLLRYLWEHKHATPFEMAGFTIEVQAPIFVMREWHRHRTQSYNEMSARYTEIPDVFYVPTTDRIQGQGKTNKQGSGEPLSRNKQVTAVDLINSANRQAYAAYTLMLQMGVAREIARLVLPVNIYSRMRATANLRNWLAFLALRLPENAQWEIRQYAEAVSMIVEEHFPRTYSLFTETSA